MTHKQLHDFLSLGIPCPLPQHNDTNMQLFIQITQGLKYLGILIIHVIMAPATLKNYLIN
jgi:hypothetical protein